MDAATLTAATFTVAGLGGQVGYDGITRTVSWLPAARALLPATTYTATLTTGVKDASGNTLAANHMWTFKTAGASEPNITDALPDAGASPVAIGAAASNRRKIVSVSNTGTGNLTIGSASLVGGDADAFLVSADGCKSKTLAPGASCSIEIALGPPCRRSRPAPCASRRTIPTRRRRACR